MIIFWFYRE